MYSKGEAIINYINNKESELYCNITWLDETKGEAWVAIEKNHTIKKKDTISIVSFHEVKGLLFYEGFVNEINTYKAVISKLKLVDEKQRRNDVRVKVNMTFPLCELHVGSNVRKLGGSILLETLDISAGGILLRSAFYVAEENVSLVFTLPLDSKPILCKAKILRKLTDKKLYLYGCQFQNSEGEKNEIRKFVFMKQLESRKMFR